jgi:hypothetical protein
MAGRLPITILRQDLLAHITSLHYLNDTQRYQKFLLFILLQIKCFRNAAFEVVVENRVEESRGVRLADSASLYPQGVHPGCP